MLLDQVASLVNRNIAASSRARQLAAQLEGRSMAVAISAPLAVSVQIRMEQGILKLSRSAPEEVDVSISGTPFSLLPLLGKDARSQLRSGSIAVTGDVEIAQAFHELLHAARPELEEELSRAFGDVAARQIGNTLRALAGWSRRTASTFADNVAEFLQEESRDLVSRTEAEEFNSAVDELREAADRLAARVDLLASRRAPGGRG